MRIIIAIILSLNTVYTVNAQMIQFQKKNGVIISKFLTDEEWKYVKPTYVPDSLKYFPLTIIDYSPEELRMMDEEVYRKTLLAKGGDSITAYSIKFIDSTTKGYKRLTDEWSTKTMERIKMEYNGAFKIKKTSEIDSTDRYLLKVGFYNSATSETSGWLSLIRFYFEDRKRQIIFPLIMRVPKEMFRKL